MSVAICVARVTAHMVGSGISDYTGLAHTCLFDINKNYSIEAPAKHLDLSTRKKKRTIVPV